MKRRHRQGRFLIPTASFFSADAAECAFPFWYRRLIYWECTDDSDVFGRKWCSLTADFNKERVWKYCDEKELEMH